MCVPFEVCLLRSRIKEWAGGEPLALSRYLVFISSAAELPHVHLGIQGSFPLPFSHEMDAMQEACMSPGHGIPTGQPQTTAAPLQSLHTSTGEVLYQ